MTAPSGGSRYYSHFQLTGTIRGIKCWRMHWKNILEFHFKVYSNLYVTWLYFYHFNQSCTQYTHQTYIRHIYDIIGKCLEVFTVYCLVQVQVAHITPVNMFSILYYGCSLTMYGRVQHIQYSVSVHQVCTYIFKKI